MDDQQESLSTPLDVTPVAEGFQKIKEQMGQVIIGQEKILRQMITALFADGHILLEGVPGIAKTLMSRLLAKTLSVQYNRIQFTPDLMPADILGTMVFNVQQSVFEFKPGPIFTQVLLIDEINRAPAKTQAALFEVMQEKQVSMDGVSHTMQEPYFVMATQNPIEQEGTYRLPEAQLDRFFFKIKLDYPDLEQEKLILRRFQFDRDEKWIERVQPVMTGEDVLKLRAIIDQVTLREELLDYIADIVVRTRTHPDLFLGASSRASLAIMRSAKVSAAIDGRYFVIPEDIQLNCIPVLNHRIILNSDRELEGQTAEETIQHIIEQIEVPK